MFNFIKYVLLKEIFGNQNYIYFKNNLTYLTYFDRIHLYVPFYLL